MAMSVRSLPVLQNWDCHGCADCCREYHVHATEEERQRIEAQGWASRPEFQGIPLFVPDRKGSRPGYRLNHRPHGACVFLDERNGCRIHAEFGSAGKPLACRVYPFVLVPTGKQWRVGLRFACPSAAGNKGRPLSVHEDEVRSYAVLLEAAEKADLERAGLPVLQKNQPVPWEDLKHFVQGIGTILEDRRDSLERRLRRCLILAKLCRPARFEKVTGVRLREFLALVIEGTREETAATAEEVPPPSWIGRILFRQLVALYSRKDRGAYQGISRRGRLALLFAAFRFARGRGPIPAVHGLMPRTTFEQAEQPAGPMEPAVQAMLERYYRLKVESLQFTGPTNFFLPFWDGLESLILTYPAISWLARVFHDHPRPEAVELAIRSVDDNFGFNPLLGLSRQRFALKILSDRLELAKLVAWYSR